MSTTITVRLPDDVAQWVEQQARALGISRGALIRELLERGRTERRELGFMRLAGCVEGPKNLSARKGFSRQ